MKCALNIYDDYVEVVEVGTSSIDYSKMRAPRSYVGFSHAHGNREGVKLGRTFAGVLDIDYDGIYESIVILVVDGGSKAGLIHDEAKIFLLMMRAKKEPYSFQAEIDLFLKVAPSVPS